MQVRTAGRPDPSFAWTDEGLVPDGLLAPGARLPTGVRGTLASVRQKDATWRITRDPLGLNKLFWAREDPSSIVVATRPHLLQAEGLSFRSIAAVPRGCVIDIGFDGVRCEQSPPVPGRGDPEPAPPLGRTATAVRRSLDDYLTALAVAHPDTQAVVCCSGGLDSSGVLALAAQHFPDVLAVSFDFDRSGGRPSEDRTVARRLCRDLDVELLEVNVDRRRLLDHLDVVLLEGVDWRDFNVHAALVNAVLAEGIAATPTERGRMVFTGDLANEFLADYHDEHYGGADYYRLPRLAPAALRRWLITGLDSTNREVGVFGAWNLPVVQPYAVATDHYLQLPGSFLAQEDAKQQLCEAVFGDLLPSYILHRSKVRAQIGDPDTGGGVLAACIDQGVDQAVLRNRFAELHKVETPAELNHFIRAGRYRSAVPEEAS